MRVRSTQPLLVALMLAPAGIRAATLEWSTYLGGAATERARAIALDAAGNVYIAGNTASANFPATAGLDTTLGGGTDAFVAKFDPTGTALLWATYLGGAANDDAFGIVVDATTGVVTVCGDTASAGFPVTSGALQTTLGGGTDAFVTRLAADGTITWSTFLGTAATDNARTCRVNADGRAYLVGATNSAVFPATGGAFDTTANGALDAFVAVLTSGGTSLVWASYLGGADADFGRGLALDSSGNVYLGGNTNSADFPTGGGFDTTLGGIRDGFVARVSADGTALTWSSYLGGEAASTETIHQVAVDATQRVYAVGETRSTTGIATVGAFDTTFGGTDDAFAVRISAAGNVLDWGTYIGGAASDIGQSIAVDAVGSPYLTGETTSDDFPKAGAFDITRHGPEAFVTKLTPDGTGVAWSSYLGGSTATGLAADDTGFGLALPSAGDAVLVAGVTLSPLLPFLELPGNDKTLDGTQDAFVVRATNVATTVARVENLRAEARDDDGVEISWRLADTTAVASLAVERTREAVAATISEITVTPLDGDEYQVLDDSPGPDPSYRLEVRYDDGSSEWFGPVAPLTDEAVPTSRGCAAGSVLGSAGTRFPVALLLALTVFGLARRRVRFA